MKNKFRDINILIQMPLNKYIYKQCKCLLLTVIYTLFSLAFPAFLSLIVDQGIKKKDLKLVCIQCLLMFACGVLMVIFQYLQQISFYKLAQEIIYNLKNTIFQKLVKRNLKFWSKYQIGDIVTVLESDIDKIQTLLTSTISNFIINFFVAIGITVILVMINPIIGGLVLIMSLAFAHYQRIYGKKVQDGMAELREEMADLSGVVNESINNMPIIQMADFIDFENNRFKRKFIY